MTSVGGRKFGEWLSVGLLEVFTSNGKRQNKYRGHEGGGSGIRSKIRTDEVCDVEGDLQVEEKTSSLKT